MKKFLKDFIQKDFISESIGSLEIEISDIETNSKEIKAKDTLFIALQGTLLNGNVFIQDAICNGAKAIIISDDSNLEHYEKNITYIKISNLKDNFGKIIDDFYDHPTSKLKIIAITGTCGKTSVAYLSQQLFNLMGYKSGLISTIQIDTCKQITKASMTTPGTATLQRFFHEMAENGALYCFIEASSHALDQGRLSGVNIYGAVFTNASDHEHLDYHKTYENYLETKQQLFNNLSKNSFSLYNADDEKGCFMVKNTISKKFSFGIKSTADFKCLFKNEIDGLRISFDKINFIKTSLVSSCNAYNILTIYSIAKICGLENKKIENGIAALQPVIGRFQTFQYKGINIIIDYAHKPKALELILENIKEFCKRDIVTVFGCGGDRDTSKRLIMTETACKYSEKVIITSDNIRTESFKKIVRDMVWDLSDENFIKTSIIFNRTEAIYFAINNAHEGDTVLIAGKGHEDYQIIGKNRFHLSDIEIVKNLIENV